MQQHSSSRPAAVAIYLADHFQRSGKTEKEVADAVGISAALLKALFDGTMKVSAENASDLAVALGVDEQHVMQLWAEQIMPTHIPFVLLTDVMKVSRFEKECLQAIRDELDRPGHPPISSTQVANRIRQALSELIQEVERPGK